MLEGLRLLDLSSRLPGPLCSLILSDLGMEVIRIESPASLGKGDIFREFPESETPYFPMLNRGKKSITLNLKTRKGKALFLKLAEKADVVLEGFRPGVAERLGIGWSRLRQANPRLILASISGYGQEGPFRNEAGHDLNYLARTGILGLNASAQGETPVCPPVQIADVAGGTYPAVVGILAALMERVRTGKGRWLDISMMDGSLFLMAMALFDHGIGKRIAPGSPPISRGSANYHVYKTRDGRYLALGALEEVFWGEFCEAVQRPEWKAFYGDEKAMSSKELCEAVQEIFMTKSQEEWLAFFQGRDVCLSSVRSIDEVASGEDIREREVFWWKILPDGERVPMLRFPMANRTVPAEKRGIPRLGEQTVPILRGELGLSDQEIETLRREGVI